MDAKQFKDLKVGDVCVIKRGRDAGKLCTVLYIKNESVLVEAQSDLFNAVGTNKGLRLTRYYELDFAK